MLKKHKHFYLIIGIFIMTILILAGGNDGELSEEARQANAASELYEYEMRYGVDVVAANASYFSLEKSGDAFRTVWRFPIYLWNMIFNPSEDQMQYFLRDGFVFSNSESVGMVERIGMKRTDKEEIYMLTWQPAESNVRRSQLIHEQKEDKLIPAATYINSEEPLVYIFNSHPQEMIGSTFADLSVGEMDVIELSHIMATILEDHGIPSLVEDRNVVDVLRANDWNYAQSYQASRIFIEERIHQHSTLQFFFDLHRDGIPHELARMDLDGKPYARTLFVIGGDNPVGYEENYAMARQLHNMLEEKIPGISRGVVISEGAYKNGVYNQDVARTLQLIEIGTVETTTEEAVNTMEVLAEVLAEYMLDYMVEE